MNFLNLSFSISVHILFSITFLFVIFMFLVSAREEKTFSDAADFLSQKVADNLPPLSAKVLSIFKENIEELERQTRVPTAAASINDIYLQIIVVVLITSILLLIVVPYFYIKLSCGRSVPMGYIILENMLLVIALGSLEIIFFLNFAIKYNPTIPSELIYPIYRDFSGPM